MSEKTLQKKIMDDLKKQGCLPVKFNAGVYGGRGVADLLVCCDGHFCAVEVKMPKKKATKNQMAFLNSVRMAGGRAGVAKNLEQARQICGLDPGIDYFENDVEY